MACGNNRCKQVDCWGPSRGKRLLSQSASNANLYAQELFKSIDANDNNVICMEEAYSHFKNQTISKRSGDYSYLEENIKLMDRNDDGVISPGEFDDSLDA